MADVTVNTAAPLPEFEKRRTFETTKPGDEKTTETTAQTPERAAAEQAEQDVEAQQEAIGAREKALAGRKAAAQEQAANEQRDISEHQLADQDFAMRSAADDIAKARARTQARQAELDKMESPSLYGNTDTHGKVVRGVAMALGGIGDAIQKAAMVRIGKAPPTIDTVGEIIDRNLNEQREHISKLKDAVVMARTGEADANDARKQMLADIDLRGAAMYKRAEGLAAARLAAMGKTQAEIDADKNIATLREKRAERHTASVAPLLEKVTNKIETATTKTGGENIERAPTAATKGTVTLNDPNTGAPITNLPQGFTPEQGADVNKQVAAYKDAKDLLAGLKQDYANGIITDPGEYQRRVAKVSRAINLFNQVEGNKRAPSKEEVDLLEKQVGGLGDVLTGGGTARIDELDRQLDNSMSKRLGGLGVEPKGALGTINQGQAAPPAPRPAPAPEQTITPKAMAIGLIKARPNAPGAALLKKKFKISDAELR